MSKKKFSLKKYLEWLIKNYGVEQLYNDLEHPECVWYLECDGLTEREMLEKDYKTSDVWMEEDQI